MSDQKIHYSSKTDEWETPQEFFNKLNKEFNFEMDLCASEKNHKCRIWTDNLEVFTKEIELFTTCSESNYYMNPPYSRGLQGKMMDCAKRLSTTGKNVICVVPARTDTIMWHKLVWNEKTNSPYSGVELRLIKGRLKFEVDGRPILDKKGNPQSAPFPSAVVIFEGVDR